MPTMVATNTVPVPRAELTTRLVVLLTIGSGLCAANIYYHQPLLLAIARDLGATQADVSLLSTGTQLGYGLGILVLVPLGDTFERRRLILTLSGVVATFLAACAVAPTFPLLTAASFLTGFTTVIPQLIIPYAATMAGPGRQGRAVGTIMSGLLIGVLSSRTVSGFVGARWGWRTMFGVAAVSMVLLGLLLRALPPQAPPQRLRFKQLFGSLFTLVATEPLLRRHALLGAVTFACLSAFWTTLAFVLATPPYHYGSEVVGLFGLVGVAGALAAPLVGRYADRSDPRVLNLGGILLVLASFALFLVAGQFLWALVVGVILLDLGGQMNHVSNQTRVFSLDPAQRSRLNTVYMVTYFLGGAIGSALGGRAWSRWHAGGVDGLGVLLALAGVAVFFFVRARPRAAT